MDKKTEQLDDLQRAKLALELSHIGLCEYGLPPRAHLNVDKSWADILGYKLKEIPRAEIFHSWWGQQIHPGDHARVINEFNQLYSGADNKVLSTFRIKHKKQGWISVEVSGTAMSRDEKGWANKVFTIMRDASSDENRYQQIVENLHEGIWIVDKYNRTRFVNQRMADMLGYDIEEILGKSLFDFMDDQNTRLCKEKLGVHRKGMSGVYDFDFMHKDGHRIYATIASSPMYNAKDVYDGTIAGVVDVSAQREQELQLKMLSSAVEQSGTMVIITNQSGDMEYVNPKFCDVTGYEKHSFGIGSDHQCLGKMSVFCVPKRRIRNR